MSERVHGNTSEAYLWIRVAYRRLRSRMAVRYPPYDKLTAEMVEAGVPGGGGTVLTAKAVRRLWLKVCEDIEAEAKARGKVAKAAPVDWKPQPTRPPAPTAAVAPRPVAAVTPRPAPIQAARPMADITSGQLASLLTKRPPESREERLLEIERTRAELRKRNE
ncbi:hypothetical protein ACFQY5_40030 [Paeniroseomonas aquatica]|uniref:KfrA N-terminal DNA-binding domain-containing protein n=1 Tax=Paeniroseomonas aquatica TaxID=373043 RepID=A0ABT8A0V3_9PROT|nr:hypothetical protein [Paeniroseomonas aquatica]MDN3563113.1 hypothetical protein [Paeniroseomonas aquatica]